MRKNRRDYIAQNEFLTVPEVADALRVCERTVRQHVRDGTIPSLKLGHRVLVPASFIRDCCQCGHVSDSVSNEPIR